MAHIEKRAPTIRVINLQGQELSINEIFPPGYNSELTNAFETLLPPPDCVSVKLEFRTLAFPLRLLQEFFLSQAALRISTDLRKPAGSDQAVPVSYRLFLYGVDDRHSVPPPKITVDYHYYGVYRPISPELVCRATLIPLIDGNWALQKIPGTVYQPGSNFWLKILNLAKLACQTNNPDLISTKRGYRK